MKLRTLFASASLALAVGFVSQASAATVIYSDPGALVGQQQWIYGLGQDFTVNSAVTISELGAFTNGGANSDVGVALYRLTDANPADGGTLVATAVVPGNANVVGDYAFVGIAPQTLTPGFYQLVSFGGSGDTNYNTGFTAAPDTDIILFNTLGGKLSVGSDFYDNGGLGIATNADSHFYGAASMAVPEPVTWAMLLVGFGGLGAVLRMGRRRGAAIAA